MEADKLGVHAASIYFVDVGQGSSTVVAFDDGNLLIIDCGPSASPLLDLLGRLTFDRIAAVVLSHWHSDHVGGASRLVENYSDRIDRILFARNRPTDELLKKSVLRDLITLSDNGRNFWIDQLVLEGGTQGYLYPWANRNQSTCHARVIYPTLIESMHEEGERDANQGSGIICIKAGEHRILIPGDAGRRAFEQVRLRSESNRLQCDVVCAPHHSGKLSQDEQAPPGFANAFEWFYQEVVEAKHVIVSAGTGNTYGHPIPAHMAAARRSGASIQCTELTKACAAETFLSVLNTGGCCVDPGNRMPGKHRSEQNHAVGCAGTIRVDLTVSETTIHRRNEHRDSIFQRLSGQQPLCQLDIDMTTN